MSPMGWARSPPSSSSSNLRIGVLLTTCPVGPGSLLGTRMHAPRAVLTGSELCTVRGSCTVPWALTRPPAPSPTGSGGSTPSPPACGPCCWGCTWLSSTCRRPHPAGWTHSSSARCPCAAWWASRRPWPRGRRQAHGGSGPEGQISSSDCGGRTDDAQARDSPSGGGTPRPCLSYSPPRLGPRAWPGPGILFFLTCRAGPQPEVLPKYPGAALHCLHLLGLKPFISGCASAVPVQPAPDPQLPAELWAQGPCCMA